ncbi:BZ3500_MvSof-1268-A1-R1_Chr3-1g06172 [Microbotryum saponariae]|uniref:BZ3500_MvSof-1268-A1-R1_Chr3-1g06172 protein n=1 Tax=Microbotryum saponariae TaxID=289078 RepID=A0A2X0LKT5_9BASI|nr:BZ3500_MvSof-1268-A1-R1_Chr3-1g06172 [Microbotryum saponariae]SDA04047.1 BZ3501_MvSof-1269-A2-R1_Chr3-2g05857 [Microbotryum saponariae]
MQAAFSTSSLAVEQEASDQDVEAMQLTNGLGSVPLHPQFLNLSLPQQGLTVRISPTADSVDASVPSARGHKANVLAVSNTFGWAVAATEPSGTSTLLIGFYDHSFVLFSLSSLHQLLSTAAAHSTPSLEPQLAVPTPHPVDHLHFAQSDHSLIVALRDGQVLVYSLKQLVQGQSLDVRQQTTPQHTLPSVGGSLLSIHGCPAEFSPLVLLVATTPSPPRIINLTSPTASQTAFPPGLMATSACWSVKGKQISVGDVDGLVAQYTPEGQLKGSIPRPSSLSAEYQVRAVEWLENTAWLITYALPTPEGQEPAHADEVFVVNKVGSGEYAHVKFFDPTPAFGLTQFEGKRWTLRLKSWAPFKHLLFLANKPSADLGAIAQFEEDGQWKGLVLPDASRPTLPMGENGDDVAPVGVALDLTGEAPSILVLTSRGVLVSWSVANSNAPQPYQGLVKAKDVTIESEPVAQDAGAATSSAPAAPTSSGFGAPSSSPFAVASTSSPSPFGPSAFGSSAFGSSAFGSTPAFGQTPALGTSVFGAAASGSSTPPVVSSGTTNAFATFGSSSTSATGFAGFGSGANSSGFGAAAAATPATSNRGSIFGSGGAFKAAPAFGKSESAPSGSATPFAAAATTTNAFGSSTSSPNPFGSKASAAPATNAFGTSTSTPAFGASTAAPAFGAPTAFGSSSAFGTATASPFGTDSPSNAFSAFGGGSSSTNNAFGASTSGGSSGFGAFAAAKPANGGSIFGSGGALGSSTSSTPGGSSTTISAFGNGGSAFGAGGSAPVFGTGSFGGSPALTIAASTPKPSFGMRKDAFNSDDEDEDVDGVDDSGARVDEPPDLEPEHTGLDLNASLKTAKSSSERVAEKASQRSAGSFGTASSGAFGMGSLGLGGSTTPAATTPTSEAKQLPVSGSASAASPGAITSPTLPPTPTPKPAESPAASPSPPAAPVSFKSGFGGFGSASSSTPQVGFGFGVGLSAPSIFTSTTPVPTTPALPKEDSDTQSTPTESKPISTLAKTSVSTPSSAKSLFGFASSPPSTLSFGKSSGETEGNSLLSRLGRIEGDQDEEGEDEEYDEEAYDEEGEYEDEEEDDNEGEGEDEGEYAEEEVGGDEQEEDVQDDDEDGDQEQQDVDASSDAADDEQAQGTSPPSPVPAKEDVKPAVKAADEPKPEAAPKAFAFSPASSPPSSTPTSVSDPKALPLAPTAPASPAISDASSQQKSTQPTFSFHAPAPVPASKPSAPTAVSAPSPQGTAKPPLFSGGSFSGFGSSVPRVPSPLGAPQNSAPSAAPAFSFAQAPKQTATSEATKPALSFDGFGAPPKPTASTSPLPSPLPTSPASASPFVFAAPSTPKAEPKPNFSFASMAPKETSKNAISFAPAAPKREVVKNSTFSFGAVSPSSSSPDPSVPATQLQAAQRASVADLAPPPKLGSQLVKAAEPVVKEKGMAGELAKAYLRMQTDFEIVARNTVILGDFVKAIGKPCQVDASSSEVAEDLDPRYWSLGDLSKLRRALLDVQPGVGKLVEEAKKQKTQVAELQALMLKAETKSEEAARFIRAKDDPVFAKMVRVRQLGPEQLENQKRLRLAMTTIKATLEQVEDHVSVLREKMVESRLGRTSFKAPSLDSVNRAVRNISSAVAEKTFELDELTLRLELMRVQPASTTTLSRSARARSASITENSMNTSFLLRASPGASVKALSSPGTTQLRPDVLATAQAALRAERSCAILKRALLNVQGPVSRLNQTASEKASSNAHEDIADLQLAFSRGPITGDRLPRPRRKPERPKTPPPAPAPVAPTIKTEPPSSALGLSMSSSSPFRSAGSQNLAAVPPPLTFKSAPQFSFATSTAPRPSSPLSGASGGSGVSRGSKISSSRSSAVKLRPSESVAAPGSEGGAPVPKSSFDWDLPAAGSSNGSGANGPSASGDRKPIGFVPFAAALVASKPFSAATTPPAQGGTGFSFAATPSPSTDFPALSGAPSFSFAPPSKITSPAAGSAAPPTFAFKGFAPVQDPKAFGSAAASLQLQHGDDEDDEEYDDEEGDEDEEDYEDEQEGDGEEDEDGEWDEDEDDEEEGLDTIVEGDEE